MITDKSSQILEKMMDVASFRQKILASNIANADTPGYKAKDISFQKELETAVEGTQVNPSGSPVQQNYKVFETVTTMPNRDGNTVNLDIEMSKVAENTLLHNTAAQLLSMKFRMIKSIIRGGA